VDATSFIASSISSGGQLAAKRSASAILLTIAQRIGLHEGGSPGSEEAMAQTLQTVPLSVLHDMLAALDRAAAASLAGGIIASSGQSHTPAEALAVQQEVLRTMFSPRR
jgi:hypothetical protein